MTGIHPTAIVDASAEIGEGVSIGPYSVVGPDVRIGDGGVLLSHVVIDGRTELGANCRVYPFASIGHQPQDMKYHGEPSTLKIGANNIFREHVTVNPGTEGGGMVTSIGNNCLFMVGAHVAHDCLVGNHVIMANNATLAGHVVVDDFAIIGGLSAIHQFCRIGRHAMVGGMSRTDVTALRKAYRLMFAEEGTLAERLQDVHESFSEHEAIMEIVDFLRSDSSRAICQPKAEQGA